MEQQPLVAYPAEFSLTTNPHLHTALESLSIDCSAEKDESLLNSSSNYYLAQVGNNFPPALTVYDIPEEILAHIFLTIINDVGPGNREEQPIKTTIRLSYRYLFTLSSVCSYWRRICLSRGSFWSLIPLYNEWKDPDCIMNLCLERAGGSAIHLGGALGDIVDARLLDIIIKYGPRIRSLNSYGSHFDVLRNTVFSLLEHSNPGCLVSLSLHNYEITKDDHGYHHTWPLLFPTNSPEQALFNTFAESLSTLRLGGFKLNWSQTRFSELVDLKIQHLSAEGLSEIADLLTAIASAPKLRTVLLVDIRLHAYSIQTRPLDRPGALPVCHPSLELLYLKDTRWSLLSHIIRSFITGSYRTVINYTRKEYLARYPSDLTSLETSPLQGYKIDTLMISRNWIQEHDVLRALLKAMPTIQTLYIARCEFTGGIFQALVRPSEVILDSNETDYPIIYRLHVICATFKHTDLNRLKEVVTSHCIQELKLGGSMGESEPEQTTIMPELERFVRFEEPKDNERTAPIRKWLKNTVPKFSLVKNIKDILDFDYLIYHL